MSDFTDAEQLVGLAKSALPPYKGSRKHVLDWLDSDHFVETMNELLASTGVRMSVGDECWPKGYSNPNEARIGKQCGSLCPEPLNVKIRDWWLAIERGANIPNWDLACKARFPDGRDGLVLVEAKAHEHEFAGGSKGKSKGNPANDERIALAIEEARTGLSLVGDVAISRDHWYQLSNRAAFAWKLASEGVPVVLIYLGFIGDNYFTRHLTSEVHWEKTVHAQPVLPREMWEKRHDVEGTDLFFLIRALPCLEQSQLS